GGFDIWAKDLVTRRETPVTVGIDNAPQSAISPDGSKVAYLSNANGHAAIYLAPIGGGAVEKICEACSTSNTNLFWSADSRQVGYALQDSATGFKWMLRDVVSG